MNDDDAATKKKKEKASAAATALSALQPRPSLVLSPFSRKTNKQTNVFLQKQLPGDAKLSYFDAENTMQEISVDELTRGKRVGESFCCFLIFFSPSFVDNIFF